MNTEFAGATGPVSFHPGEIDQLSESIIMRGDRQTAITYSIFNYHGDSTRPVLTGRWTMGETVSNISIDVDQLTWSAGSRPVDKLCRNGIEEWIVCVDVDAKNSVEGSIIAVIIACLSLVVLGGVGVVILAKHIVNK
eukprot:SAG31_NODE_9584_length_1256_cov_0.920484_2_plen_136_part_01